MRARGLVLIPLLASGCFLSHGVGDDGDGEVAPASHSLRFVGRWEVTQPMHALWESTTYEFDSSGALNILEACDSYGEWYETGSVSAPSGSPECYFGTAWESPNEQTLRIVGRCSDGRAREIDLRFDNDPATNTMPWVNAQVISVGGESGWDHMPLSTGGYEWGWQKCVPGGGCLGCPD